MYNINDDYQDIDSIDGMIDFSERDLIDKDIKEVRAEVRKEQRERHTSYKFSLPRITK